MKDYHNIIAVNKAIVDATTEIGKSIQINNYWLIKISCRYIPLPNVA